MTAPKIIAELSCNHLGNLDRALALVDAAAEAGADAVKLQCWAPDRMVLDRGYRIRGGPWDGRVLADLYREAWTPWDWYGDIFARAREHGIEAFASVFDAEALAFLERIGCPRYKIASFELVDLPLIRAVAHVGKPLILSTGMASADEIRDAVTTACRGRLGPAGVTVLQCTSAYPAGVEEANLCMLRYLRDRYLVDVGVSDHTLGATVPAVAAAMGAAMVEKHLCLSRADGGPDAGFSSEPAEFAAMVRLVREAAAVMGAPRYGPVPGEAAHAALRRSLYWALPIAAGETITPEHIRTARPAAGLPPKMLDSLIGRAATRAASAGEPVTDAWA